MFRIGVLSTERHWAREVAKIFPEWEMSLDQLATTSQILLAGMGNWDALVLDLDFIEPVVSNPTDFVDLAVSRSHHVVVLIPPRLAELEKRYAGTGIFVLRKPTSSGEIALALRMLLRA